MRIALVTPGFSAHDSDWCIPALQDLARSLAERHDVHVFATTYPHRNDNYTVKGVPVSSLGDGRQGRLAHTRRMAKTVAAIESAHCNTPFDVLHGFWSDDGGAVTAWAARRLALPNVVTVMAGELTFEPASAYGKRHRPVTGRIARYGARQADTLVVNSEFHAREVKAVLPKLAPAIIPLGVDTVRHRREGAAQSLDGDVAVLCVASLVPVKGHDDLLRAIALARCSRLHLHLIGEGILEGRLRDQAEELGISERVSFHGHVEHDVLPEYYRGASFCVLGSYFESHGMVILEAAACGKITIGTGVGSMPEFCPPEMQSAPGDADALAANIVTVANDVALRARLEDLAEQKVRDKYRLEQSVHVYEHVYQDCQSGRRER